MGEDTESVTVGGGKKRKKRTSGGGGGGGLLGKLKKPPKAATKQQHQQQQQPADRFLGADAEAKMAERKAQRERLRELRERSEAAAAGEDNDAEAHRASKKQRRKEKKSQKKGGNDEKPKKKKEGKLSRFRKKADPPLDGNELFDRWRANQETLPDDFHRLLDPMLDDEMRGDLFEAEDEEAQEKYAWAIPDERALKACAAFSPLVEIGAGAAVSGATAHRMTLPAV